MDDGARHSPGTRHDHPRAAERHGEQLLGRSSKARRIGVEAEETAVGRTDDVVDGADLARLILDLVDESRHELLVRRCHAQPQPFGAVRISDSLRHVRLFELEQLVAAVDPGGVEGRVEHDDRMPPPEWLAQERDAQRHAAATAILRAGPAVDGNLTLAMISSIHARSCAGSGVIVWSMKYSTPASMRAWREATISSGVPKR